MEEEMLSMISYAKLNMNIEESSDSNCSMHNISSNACKRSRVERFKGVVPQQNGHWGAQIYSNHHRIWLGTFKSEIDAAMAYDSAAIKLRSGDSHRNLPWTNISVQEPKFQSHFIADIVLSMIRDGSYPSKFVDFLRSQQGEKEMGLNLSSIHGDEEFSCTLLFQKELTPSDVGKLNRLVIPKKYAVKYFPHVPDHNLNINVDDQRSVDEVQLEFYDKQMRLWKFRYCYWKSSQSFVFTRGWNRFVKEKGLRANETIAFYMYESRDGRRLVGQSFLVIDHVASKDDDNDDSRIDDDKLQIEMLDLGRINAKEETQELGDHKAFWRSQGSAPAPAPTPTNDTKGFRLFGVQID